MDEMVSRGHKFKMWTESRGRLPTYLLVGGSGPNVVHACNFFFFLNEYKICLPGGRRILVHIFRGPRIFGLWLMFSEEQRFWILAHVFKDLGFLDLGTCFQRTKGFLGFGSCFQRPRIFESWLTFSEDQGFWGFGSCFQRTKGSRSWLMFSEA